MTKRSVRQIHEDDQLDAEMRGYFASGGRIHRTSAAERAALEAYLVAAPDYCAHVNADAPGLINVQWSPRRPHVMQCLRCVEAPQAAATDDSCDHCHWRPASGWSEIPFPVKRRVRLTVFLRLCDECNDFPPEPEVA